MIRRRARAGAIALTFALLAAACGSDDGGADAPAATVADGTIQAGSDTTDGTSAPETTTTAPAPLLGLRMETLATELAQPTFVVSPPGDERMFIGLRGGVILIYDPERGLLDEPFLNIPDRVRSNGIEQGLLGMAFHPDYATNGRFFIYHNDRDAQRQLAEYAVLPDNPDKADLDSGIALFDRAQPPGSTDIRHYGGMLIFGPDGYLYISSGDGAAGLSTGQDPSNFFGTILRIDVDSGELYGVPADNPFVNGGGAPEVWAFGLRNPWRVTIDGDMMYIADVGQGDIEEINAVSLAQGGTNFGWATMEGSSCFSPSDCDPTGLTLPIYEYDHSEGCSVTGGHVYRGAAMPELHGHYFFADWCDSWIRSILYEDGSVVELRDWSADLRDVGSINAFGVDNEGELYFVTHEGLFAKLVPAR